MEPWSFRIEEGLMGDKQAARRIRLLLCLAAALWFAGGLPAQAPEPGKPADATNAQPPAAASREQQATPVGGVIRTESRIVLVDAIVTDKKGHYIPDLKKEDFKVYEDNKEQSISSFSSGADPAVQNAANQRHYLILFFDTSSMEMADQMQARNAATKFIDSNTNPDALVAVVNFGGSLQIRQNFTANAELLKAAVSSSTVPHIESNAPQQTMVATIGMPTISNAETDFGARSMLLSIRSLAKNLRAVPGRKMLILFTAGFPMSVESLSELTATIDACNKANVAIYPLDVRGLVAGGPAAKLAPQRKAGTTVLASAALDGARSIGPRLLLSSYRPTEYAEPQHPGGGGGGGAGGGGGGHGGGGTGAGGTGGGGTGAGGGKGGSGGGTGGTGGSGGGKGGTGGTGGGKGGTGGTGGGGGGRTPTNVYSNYYNNPMNQPQILLPKIPPSTSENQQVMQMLADGTGGFTIYNTNDLLGGLQRIAQEMNQFYVLGYVPQESKEGSCHTLKVKMNKGGMEVRSRSGYCNVRPADPLEGKPLEKTMEAQASGTAVGTIHAAMQTPYFYSAPNIARVNLSMEIPGDALVFNKDKGKYRANVNVLGIAYKPDGSVGARFSDTLNLEMEKDEWKEFTKQPYKYQNEFDAAAGTYKLAVVLSSGGEGFAKMETPLQIDSYGGEKMTLGGVVLSTSVQRVDEIPTDVDATLLEDRKPLIVKGMQINPAAAYQFKKADSVTLYSEVYEPLLKTDPTTKLAAGYRIFDKATNKELFFTGGIPMDSFIEKGNSVVPFALRVETKDLPPGNYRLVLLAVDGKNNQAPQRPVEFSLN
jgi:VWFA-related protein